MENETMIEIMQQINNLRMFFNFEEAMICLNSDLYKDITNPVHFPCAMHQTGDRLILDYYIVDGLRCRFTIDDIYYKQPRVYVIPTKK